MHRYFLIAVLIIFFFAGIASSESFKVVNVQDNLKEAVLYDRDTGDEWVVKVGDQVNGWTVTVITHEYVTVYKPLPDQPGLLMKIPVHDQIEKFSDHQEH